MSKVVQAEDGRLKKGPFYKRLRVLSLCKILMSDRRHAPSNHLMHSAYGIISMKGAISSTLTYASARFICVLPLARGELSLNKLKVR